MATLRKQRALENAAWRQSTEKLHKKTLKNSQNKIGSTNQNSRKIMGEAVRVIAAEIRLRRKAMVGLPARYSRFLEEQGVDPQTAAYLTIKTCLDLLSYGSFATECYYDQLCRKVASHVEDHARMLAFRKAEKNLLYAAREITNRQAKGRGHRRTKLLRAAKAGGIEWDSWNLKTRQELGIFLLHCMRLRTGLVEFPALGVGKQMRKYARLTDSAISWMKELIEEESLRSSLTPPTLIKPRNWEGVYRGGYYTEALRFPAIKLNATKYLKDADAIHQPKEYHCLNTLQKTKWALNQDLAGVIEECMERDLRIAGLPGSEATVPESPFTKRIPKEEMTEAQREVLKEYSLLARKIREQNATDRSLRLHLIQCMQTARSYRDRAFYYVYYSDFRGRKYPAYSPLSPQGPDFSRSLLKFWKGIPITSKPAEIMLASHGAAMYGNDKISLDERHLWVKEIEDHIVKCAEAPLDYDYWQEADKPFQFLAFCFEWSNYIKEGNSFYSHLPVQMDGSNNGLQHFSALMLDPIGAELTNLTPSDQPQDIYQAVANECKAMVQEEAHQGNSIARGWMDWGITRKTVKRSVMIIPYGGTLSAMRLYVSDQIQEGHAAGKAIPWANKGLRPTCWKESGYLAGKIMKAIDKVMKCANQTMDWIRDAARTYADAGLPLTWQTPSGFRVLQNYLKVSARRTTTVLDGTFIAMRFPNETDKIHKQRAVQGSSPNFIHSLDASHLTETVLACADQGIKDQMTIHDCFAVHASNAPRLSYQLRKQFVELHTPDLLDNFKRQLERYGPALPAAPTRGDLNLSAVLESKYLFS